MSNDPLIQVQDPEEVDSALYVLQQIKSNRCIVSLQTFGL